MDPSQLPLDHPLVVEALTGIRSRSLHLAFALNDALDLKLTTDQELELANRIGNHTMAMEWPEAVKFHAQAHCLPPTETV